MQFNCKRLICTYLRRHCIICQAREKQEATQEKDDNAIALVYSSSLPGQMRPIGPALPRPGIPGISIQLSGMYNFPYQTQRAAHAFSAMEMQSAPPPPPILVTSASASIAAQLANRAQSKGLASDATSDDVISTVEPIDEDRITAIDGEVNGDHARESSASLSSAIGGTTNTRKRKATNNDSDNAGKAPLLIAATPVMPLSYVSSSSMQGMPAFLYRQDAGMMPVGIDNNYLQNSMPAHMPGVSAAFTGTLPGTMNAAMVAQATSSSNSSITTSSNKMPLSLQHMEFSSTQANEPIREPSFVSEDPLATSNASDTMKKKSRNGSEGLTNQGEIDKTGKSASPDKRRKLKFLTSTDNAFLLEHVPSYVDTVSLILSF